jgi:hypothetical protein
LLKQETFKNRILRRIFGPKRDEIVRDWRKLHSEELHSFYSPLNVMRGLRRWRTS